MQETTNYKLQIYELSDANNMVDGYNNSMYKIDEALQSNSEGITEVETNLSKKFDDKFPVKSIDIANGAS